MCDRSGLFPILEDGAVPERFVAEFFGQQIAGISQRVTLIALRTYICKRLDRARKPARNIMDRTSRTGCACSNSLSTET